MNSSQRLHRLPVNLIVKLHDRSRDLRERYSGGVDWVARLNPLLVRGRSVIAPGHDISPYLVAADLMVTDHSSAGFEFLLRDKPIVRIHRPALIELANIHADYVNLLASVSESVEQRRRRRHGDRTRARRPGCAQRRARVATARDLFHAPGGATERSVDALYNSSSSTAVAGQRPGLRTMPAVSVIMPAYNVAPYIGAAIESVLNQTYDDLELLIVDDGATDRSDVIADQYAARDPRVRVIRQANAGISAARNHALRVASSPVIALLDSDDAWKPAYLREQMAIFRDHPGVDIITGNAWFLGSSLHGSSGAAVAGFPTAHRRSPISWPTRPQCSSCRSSVGACTRASGRFDESLRTNEDYDFWLRAACAGFVFYRNDQPLGYYRRRDNSLSADELRMLPRHSPRVSEASPATAHTTLRARDSGCPDRTVRD